MTTQEINKTLHELLGLSGPVSDYCGDPRLVIKAMMERKDWEGFQWRICQEENIHCVDIDLIMDTTGKLALLAIGWLKEKRK
jgi:hypothetical protein